MQTNLYPLLDSVSRKEKSSELEQFIYYKIEDWLNGAGKVEDALQNEEDDDYGFNVWSTYKTTTTAGFNESDILSLIPTSEVSAITSISPKTYAMYQDLKKIWINTSRAVDDEEEKPFITSLRIFVEAYGKEAIEPIRMFIQSQLSESTLASEIVEMLGDIKNSLAYDGIRSLLEESLANNNSKIRYGAVLGIDNLGAKELLPALKIAFKKEKNSLIASAIESTIKYFENK